MIGFFADGKVKTLKLDGGVPQAIADAPDGRGGSWSTEGFILFTPSFAGGIVRGGGVRWDGGDHPYARDSPVPAAIAIRSCCRMDGTSSSWRTPVLSRPPFLLPPSMAPRQSV